jgi:integrase
MKKRVGAIIERGGRLHLRYVIEGVQFQTPLNTSSWSEAERLRDQFMSNRQGGLDQYEHFLKGELERIRRHKTGDAMCTIALPDVWRAFLKSPKRPQARESALCHYKSAWDQFAAGLDSSRKRLGDVTEQDAHDRMDAIYSKKLAQGTAEKHLIYLTALFNALLPEGVKNPFSNAVARGSDSGDDLSYVPVTLDQTRLLLASTGRPVGSRNSEEVHKELYGVFLTLAYTGLRLGDACGLMCEEVHFDRKVLVVLVNKTKRSKKGKAAYAKIGLHPALAAVLREQIGDRTTGPVFTRISRWNCGRQSNNVQLVFRKAGVERRVQSSSGMRNLFGASSFRHMMEDRLREAKVPQATANVILCHSDPSMAATYSTIRDEELYEAIVSAYPDLRPDAESKLIKFQQAG